MSPQTPRPPRTASRVLLAAAITLMCNAATAPAAIIGDADRHLVAPWAVAHGIDPRTAERMFAATGAVVCTWTDPTGILHTGYSTGQVTEARDVITLAGHVFFDLFSCDPKAAPDGCQFTVEVDGVPQTANTIAVEAIGFDCDRPLMPGNDRPRGDWAVARLDHALDVEPYQVIANAEDILVPGATVRSVTFSQDYLVPVDGLETHPKTVGECAVRDILNRFRQLVYFASDCDGAQRSSGGSILAPDLTQPTLVGIWAASTEDSRMLSEAVGRILAAGFYRHDLANRGEYVVNGWSSRHIPVTGDLLDAILAAAARSAGPGP